uniref:Uncharacterized protein n=1 Tax=Anguilla anguilla TaxID=7936 RepID=A0A0E9PAI9_ANGAN
MGQGCQTSVLEGLPGDLPPLHKREGEGLPVHGQALKYLHLNTTK